MGSDNKEICRPDSPMDGPADGVQMRVDCIRTDFIDNPNGEGAVFQQSEKSNAHISASVEIGIFSIRDMQSGVMLSVCLGDAAEVIHEAIKVSKEVE